ncbi:hypothetical protein GUITHDRAFT_110174 [Guillardia theta CCMP2712]|uniref:Uncharacterized protein n=1 Tax=Guillardia theta (strain CCMP2712) TaxID=905079 RepID=L1J6L2_GUITC|nr:hypothetical protein GUITHDRAFT_110174 [Guillardia theta CCMP2712]EKX43720.1 hypothetical protein GUITHDRAFT_110174 [Guillardia theta CCMP2712]|eukprot:XP_005830700.1 hypothetical protein GUITHDRAFT_110174 [Guillardia theta CCMP2712]
MELELHCPVDRIPQLDKAHKNQQKSGVCDSEMSLQGKETEYHLKYPVDNSIQPDRSRIQKANHQYNNIPLYKQGIAKLSSVSGWEKSIQLGMEIGPRETSVPCWTWQAVIFSYQISSDIEFLADNNVPMHNPVEELMSLASTSRIGLESRGCEDPGGQKYPGGHCRMPPVEEPDGQYAPGGHKTQST